MSVTYARLSDPDPCLYDSRVDKNGSRRQDWVRSVRVEHTGGTGLAPVRSLKPLRPRFTAAVCFVSLYRCSLKACRPPAHANVGRLIRPYQMSVFLFTGIVHQVSPLAQVVALKHSLLAKFSNSAFHGSVLVIAVLTRLAT
jgi:hypothetical protein